ncbi:MAG TPA: nitroreductase/quinone reductase family protein [Acidimicrobiales bacterium]|nr:nitroreductase/quinone reductase family protein [Acidimicrobiales bacterium]
MAAMEASDADEVWVMAGMRHVLLRTVGRKSGREHKVALPYWSDAAGHRVVVGSFAGAPQHPSWYLNLTDRDANPELFLLDQGRPFWAEAQVLDGTEYDETWAAICADRPFYANYQTRTDRRLPLVRLVETRSA